MEAHRHEAGGAGERLEALRKRIMENMGEIEEQAGHHVARENPLVRFWLKSEDFILNTNVV